MATYPFLSDEWVEEARKLREAFSEAGKKTPHEIKMNLIITDAPHGEDGGIQAHLDTTDGAMKFDKGHIEPADLTITLEFDVAKAILIDGNPQAGMQAFMSGKIRVDGDMGKLMMMQTTALDEDAQEFARQLKAITS